MHQVADPARGRKLTFIAVAGARGGGSPAQAALSDAQAARAVDTAGAAARADGIEATTLIVDAHDVGSTLLEAARHAGLLVVGAHSHQSMAGLIPGSIASGVEKAAAVPVLLARSRPELGFPGVAMGSEPRAPGTATQWVVAATIAARHDTRVVLAHVGAPDVDSPARARRDGGRGARHHRQGSVVVSVGGHPVERLSAMARSVGAGLVVLGSQGDRDLDGLPGVSEGVAQACNVFGARPGTGRGELRTGAQNPASAAAYRSRMERALRAAVIRG